MSTLSLEDRFAIQDLYMRYNVAFDSGDDEAWVQTFAADGTFALGGEVTGHEALRADRARRHAAAAGQEHHNAQHWNDNLLLVPRDDHVEAVCYLLRPARNRADGTVVVLALSCYHDRVVRTPDGWRFARRELVTDMADLPRGLVEASRS